MELAATDIRYRREPQAGAHLPRRILVVVDPAVHEQPALEKAARIATACGGTLELYVCDVEQQVPESWAGGARFDEYRGLLRQRLLADLQALAQPLRARGLAVELVCAWRTPLEPGIGPHVLRTQPDLVVKETRRPAPPPRAALSPADWNLMTQVPVPVLLVRSRSWPPAVSFAAAVALDAAIVDNSRALAQALDGSLEVGGLVADVLVAGTVAQVLERVDCDVLVVKSPGFASPLQLTGAQGN